MANELDRHPSAVVGFISTAEIARILGKSKARAGRDWCKRHNVPLHLDGKINLARIEDVRRAFEAVPAANDSPGSQQRVAAAVARITARRR